MRTLRPRTALLAGMIHLAAFGADSEWQQNGIPLNQLGAEAQKQYSGDGISITPTTEGALLRAAFQKLEGQASRQGLWLTSMPNTGNGSGERFRVLATSIGRAGSPSDYLAKLPATGTVHATPDVATFIRHGLVEEYRVSMDGVRQDFIVLERPAGDGELRLRLDVTGARVKTARYGVTLTLTGSGRPIAYSRLLVTDANGKKLEARMEVETGNLIAVAINDAAATYPIRIDPTFSDADWVSLNPGGVPGANGTVNAIAVDDSGNLYIGGTFTVVGALTFNRIAKWDGNTWSPLGSGMNSPVNAIVVDGTNVYVGGYFLTAGGVSANRIARWDGVSWSALGDGVSNIVNTLAFSGTDLYVGGSFTSAGGQSANYIAKWDGGAWSPVGTGMNGAVHTLAVNGTDVYAGGGFTTANGVSATYVAKWDGSAWSSLGLGMNGLVRALAISGTELYAGGDFTLAGGVPASRIAKWDGNSWSALDTGMNSTVSALGAHATGIYAGGSFTSAGGVDVNYIAKWDGTTWSPLGTGLNLYVYALVVNGADLFAGGLFSSAGGVLNTNYIAKWNTSDWSALSTGSGLNSEVRSLALSGTDLYIGGRFTTTDGVSHASYIAKWDGTTWSPLGSGMNGFVYALAANGTDLYAGGTFTTAGGVSANRIAKWDGNTWSPLGSGMNSTVAALAVSGTDVYAGGSFTTVDGVATNRIAKWDGSTWSGLGSGMNSVVTALAASGTNIYAGGGFTTAGGITSNRIAKWDGTTWSALGSGMNGSVEALVLNGTDLYAGGSFTTAGGVTVNRVARWDGTSWLALGSGITSTVRALAVSGTDLYAGGSFGSSGGVSTNRISRWDGSLWTHLGNGADGTVYALAADASNHLFVGGDFGMVGATTLSPFIAQANLNVEHPEIAVEQPAGTGLTDGASGVAFGTALLGSVVGTNNDRVFTIRNTGMIDLTGIAIVIDGVNAGDFDVLSSPATFLAGGASGTFTIRFNPTGLGTRMANLHIASNDPEETSFDVTLSGIAVTGAAMSPEEIAQQAYLKASNTGIGDNFGYAVAISGDTVVVGALLEDSNATGVNGSGANNSLDASGAVYVFVRDGSAWTQQAYLKASNPGFANLFGHSVAIDGDTIVVGAIGESNGASGVNGPQNFDYISQSGAAYVFVRTGTTWSQQAYLKAVNPGENDHFGQSVAISGNTVVVSADGEDSNATGVDHDAFNDLAPDSGAAFVYARSGSFWSFQGYLKASNTGAGDGFGGWSYGGSSVSIAGDTIVVGAHNEDSNATGINAPIAGSSGTQQDDSASDSGAAYVFTRSGTTWSQQGYIKASNTNAGDEFGNSVGASANTLVVGAPGEDSDAKGVNPATGTFTGQNSNIFSNSGAAYVFVRSGTGWGQEAYLKASNTESNDRFGVAVGVSGDNIAVGARYEDSNAGGVNAAAVGGTGTQGDNSAADSGAAYVFARWGSQWILRAYLKASNPGSDDGFGNSVAISGQTSVIGSWMEDGNASGVNAPLSGGSGTQADNSSDGAGAAYTFSGLTPVSPPVVINPFSSNVTAGTALLHGTMESTGNLTVTERGIVFSTVPLSPPYFIAGNAKVYQTGSFIAGGYAFGVGNGSTSLAPGTPYQYAAYASNVLGTSYSPVTDFVTLSPTGLESWRYTHFSNTKNSHAAADLNDFDNDGMSNLLEFAFGLNPTLASGMLLPQPQLSGGNFLFDFIEPAGISGITYGAEWSSTLQPIDWHAIPDIGTPPQHLFSLPISTNERLFLRLRITSP